MSPKPREYAERRAEHMSLEYLRARHELTHRRRPMLDTVMAVLLIVAWLLLASLATYAGSLPAIVLLWAAFAVLDWQVWRLYREHTAPSMLDKPQPATKPDIPLLVRLMALPGAQHIVGPDNVRKARRIRFMRTDLHRRALEARKAEHSQTFSRATGTIPTDHAHPKRGHPTDARGFELQRLLLGIAAAYPEGTWEHRWREGMDRWAEANPGQCSGSLHLFTFAQDCCRCGEWHWDSLDDVR